MTIIINDPRPLVLADMLIVGEAEEVVFDPIALAFEDPALRCSADWLELQLSFFGNLATEAADVDLRAYRRPGALAEQRDSAPASTITIPVADGAALGTEVVTNGDFTLATGWNTPTGWTIGGGTASHAGTHRSRLSRSGLELSAGGHLFQFAIMAATAGYELNIKLTSPALESGALLLKRLSSVPAAFPHFVGVFLPDLPALVAADHVDLNIEAIGAVEIDAVSLRPCTPYRHTAWYTADVLGSAAVFGILPSIAIATYLRATARRFSEQR